MIRDVIRNGGRERLDEIMAAIQETGGLEYAEQLAQSEADQALSALTALPATPYREALAALVRFAIAREH
jgi:octaprenyl-diphosphate synthase